jgi:hypothetical protein
MNVAQHTVEFDVVLENGQKVGSMESPALPMAGDELRVDEPHKQPIYEVVRRVFEPDNVTVIVRPVNGDAPESPLSPFTRQAPGAGGFQ